MRRTRWFALGLAVTAIGLGGCGDDDDGDSGGTTAPAAAPAATGGDAILIKTSVKFEGDAASGEILDGSRIGDSDFCPDGKFSDRRGVPPEGTVVKTIDCDDGQLTITFTPGEPVETKDSRVQSGAWSIIGGTGSFEELELRGEGQFEGRFPKEDDTRGNETFTGTTGP